VADDDFDLSEAELPLTIDADRNQRSCGWSRSTPRSPTTSLPSVAGEIRAIPRPAVYRHLL